MKNEFSEKLNTNIEWDSKIYQTAQNFIRALEENIKYSHYVFY